MADWQVMAHPIDVEGVNYDVPMTLPAGWEPFSLSYARQGTLAVVLCKRPADDGTLPPSDKPEITSLSPDSLASGGTPATVEVLGSNFDSSSVINADGEARATFYLDSTHLEYTARPDIEPAGVVQITVVNANGTSNAVPFTYT